MSAATDTCRYCLSPDFYVNPRPDTQHGAELKCRKCNRHLRWTGKPGVSVMPVVARDASLPPAVLSGTPAQVAAGQSIRLGMVARYRAEGRPDVVAVLASITSAGWFLANRNRPFGEIRWPGPEQLEGETV